MSDHRITLHVALMATASPLLVSTPTAAQTRLDRADPTIVEQTLPKPSVVPADPQAPLIQPPAIATAVAPTRTGTIAAVIVDSGGEIPPAVFAPAYADAIGRDLDGAALAALVERIADAARKTGYPFASGAIDAQTMRGGVLRVRVDPGKIDAVRVIGARSTAADALLGKALATGHAVRRRQLERALLLVGDIPGLRVASTRYVRQDGFGILLVTIAVDRASAYAQVDNRGSREVGPLRSTLLGSLRGIASSGDELALLVSQTPTEPSEFAFVRARYAAPVDRGGSILSVSGSYGRSHPGGFLRPLDVIGRSVDLGVTYARPLVRSRDRSLWTSVELRAVTIRQTLLGRLLRDDRLATLTGSVNGASRVANGVLRGEVGVTAGLPLGGVTHQGDLRTSRPDGDARFVSAGYTADWTWRLAPPVSVVVASSGQLASRPLLATAEIGLGGPVFGRGYDYAERTGDQGILGSVELRGDFGPFIPHLIERVQLYGFVDGGMVTNVRGGTGGGSLFSGGGGVRFGLVGLDAMVEAALPINADRFDTRDKRPRISFRLSRAF